MEHTVSRNGYGARKALSPLTAVHCEGQKESGCDVTFNYETIIRAMHTWPYAQLGYFEDVGKYMCK